MIKVESSNVRAVDYDPFFAALTIKFHGGGLYEYYRVPYAEFSGLLNASSHGKYFHAHIKGRYSFRKISE